MNNYFNILKNNWKFFVIAIGILIVANTFNGILSISSFEKMYTDSVLSIYRDAAVNLKRTIELSIKFGKQLHEFYGINMLLEQFKEENSNITDISIARPGGEILYSLDSAKVHTVIPSNLIPDYLQGKETLCKYNPEKKLHDGMYYIFLEIRDKKKEITGMINVTFKESLVKQPLNLIIQWNLKKLAKTTLVVSVLLFSSMVWLFDFSTGRFQRKRLYCLLFLFLCLGQMIYSYYSITYFHEKYVGIIHLKTLGIQNQLTTEIEKFLTAGINICKLNKIDERLKSIADSTPYIDNINVLNKDMQLLCSAYDKHEDFPIKNNMESKQILQGTLKSKELISGHIQIQISKSAIQKKIFEIIMDSVTVLLISLVFITELLFFMFIFI
ncbi:hypothetical protein [Desulfobacula phenolica]|uniref:Uncharacterized protein n=1 Tax=Desulfobacula phenolica TaxID=90732 RepID=A0A1H2DQ82_9BACT|nr:hypothetical protein [Desulfobacula phenolica]SDT85015.1 hypothetical protein SAMN04487931_101480 [Desulfobacula phenolica]